MSFLYPSFLWALGVLLIPIIIHLFNFRRTTRVYFSNNRFLRQVKEATTAKRRLKHYLILASRLLFLFFLVITFCQPIIPAREQMGGNRNIVLYLDNSQSMSAQMDDKTRGLDAAIDFVNSIAERFPPIHGISSLQMTLPLFRTPLKPVTKFRSCSHRYVSRP